MGDGVISNLKPEDWSGKFLQYSMDGINRVAISDSCRSILSEYAHNNELYFLLDESGQLKHGVKWYGVEIE